MTAVQDSPLTAGEKCKAAAALADVHSWAGSAWRRLGNEMLPLTRADALADIDEMAEQLKEIRVLLSGAELPSAAAPPALPAFGQVREEPCPRCGGQVVYSYGNWHCGGPGGEGCTWSTARDVSGGRVTLEKCPECGGAVIYNGNYFCADWGDGCNWALPAPARKKADRELALRLLGKAS